MLSQLGIPGMNSSGLEEIELNVVSTDEMCTHSSGVTSRQCTDKLALFSFCILAHLRIVLFGLLIYCSGTRSSYPTTSKLIADASSLFKSPHVAPVVVISAAFLWHTQRHTPSMTAAC